MLKTLAETLALSKCPAALCRPVVIEVFSMALNRGVPGGVVIGVDRNKHSAGDGDWDWGTRSGFKSGGIEQGVLSVRRWRPISLSIGSEVIQVDLVVGGFYGHEGGIESLGVS